MPLINNNFNRFRWNSEYDSILFDLKFGKQRTIWNTIALQMKQRIHEIYGESNPFPTGKQCRERWFDHLDPDVSRNPFTPEQIELIIAKKREGIGFAAIGRELKHPGNQVKNAYYSNRPKSTSSSEQHSKRYQYPVIDTFEEITALDFPNLVDSPIIPNETTDIEPPAVFSNVDALDQLGFFSTSQNIEFKPSYKPDLRELIQGMIDTSRLNLI